MFTADGGRCSRAGACSPADRRSRRSAFDADADLLKTPADIYVGEVAGVGANSKGQIFVYTRTGHPYATLGDNRTFMRGGSRLFQFDPTGQFVRELGQDVYGFNAAIGLRVDPQDNVWTIDAAANQVVKFDPQGRIALVLGRKPEAIAVARRSRRRGPGGGGTGGGARRPAPARRDRASIGRPMSPGIAPATSTSPTASATTTASRSSTRTAASSRTGDRPAPARASSRGVKAIAIDAQDNVYVADAGNKRIQVFDAHGTFKSEFGNVGTPLAMCMTRGATQYLYISHAGDEDGMEDAAIYKVQLDGKVVGRFGSAGKLPKQFGLANSIDCRNEHELLVGEMTNWRVQRITLR